MNPATLILALFDWRGTLARGAYRRNAAILVFVDLILRRLDLLGASALIAWTALMWAVGLSFIARRYHDMGRSAAWIVWANLIAAALALIVFQFYPDALNAIPLPDWLRPGGQAEWVIGRLVLPAVVGAAVGSLAQSLWLAWGPSYVGANPYARHVPARASASRDESIADEAAAQQIIDRHLAARKSEPAAEASAPTPAPRQKIAPPRRDPQIQRVFGRRGL
jgi:hypothetical protein